MPRRKSSSTLLSRQLKSKALIATTCPKRAKAKHHQVRRSIPERKALPGPTSQRPCRRKRITYSFLTRFLRKNRIPKAVAGSSRTKGAPLRWMMRIKAVKDQITVGTSLSPLGSHSFHLPGAAASTATPRKRKPQEAEIISGTQRRHPHRPHLLKHT